MGNPQTLNLYSYVQNNPITGTDPDGHADVNESPGAVSMDHDHPNDPKGRQKPQPQNSNPNGTSQAKPTPQPKPQVVAVGEVQPLHAAITPQAPGAIKQPDVLWKAEVMKGYVIVEDLPRAKITMQEKQTAGKDKPTICSNPCSSNGVLEDNQHVSSVDGTATVEQRFKVNDQPVKAIVMKPDGTVLAEGKVIEAQITASGSTFKGKD